MAIINCPECGHQVSDHAPICPNCGVEISGKVMPCPKCGCTILQDYSTCPHCKNVISSINSKQIKRPPKINRLATEQKTMKKSSVRPYLFVIIFTLLAAISALYLYRSNLNKRETAAYEKAIQSSDPALLRSYLSNFSYAPQQHLDSIQSRLDMLNTIDEEWENVKMMRARGPLQDYLIKYPETKHRGEIENMLDSIDWQQACRTDNVDIFQQYVANHPYGKYADEARERINELKAKIVQPEEREMVAKLLRQFFLSVNQRDEAKLTASLSPQMTSFLGVNNPTESDVKEWMHRQYKEDVAEIVWRLSHDYAISKREVGDNAYEYTVRFSATEDIKRMDSQKSSTEHYRITAQLTPDGLLSGMIINKD